jgi:flavin reductase (DIM6/NTAB) family NADH-FMN oxidoreductase RutF
MYPGFTLKDPYKIDESVFRMIGKDWMLITSGNMQSYNMMTASWGNLGILWNKPIASVFVRPQRYTYEFLEKNEFFTLTFFDHKYRSLLNKLGSESGRNTNKMNIEGLDAVGTNHNAVFFQQSRLVMECRKVYYADINPDHFLDKTIAGMYPNNDFHRMYIGEIINLMMRE